MFVPSKNCLKLFICQTLMFLVGINFVETFVNGENEFRSNPDKFNCQSNDISMVRTILSDPENQLILVDTSPIEVDVMQLKPYRYDHKHIKTLKLIYKTYNIKDAYIAGYENIRGVVLNDQMVPILDKSSKNMIMWYKKQIVLWKEGLYYSIRMHIVKKELFKVGDDAYKANGCLVKDHTNLSVMKNKVESNDTTDRNNARNIIEMPHANINNPIIINIENYNTGSNRNVIEEVATEKIINDEIKDKLNTDIEPDNDDNSEKYLDDKEMVVMKDENILIRNEIPEEIKIEEYLEDDSAQKVSEDIINKTDDPSDKYEPEYFDFTDDEIEDDDFMDGFVLDEELFGSGMVFNDNRASRDTDDGIVEDDLTEMNMYEISDNDEEIDDINYCNPHVIFQPKETLVCKIADDGQLDDVDIVEGIMAKYK